jgi:F0F1-type ATP synthase delta subunit
MIAGSLSRRYTKALFQLAREARQEEKIGQEIESFLGAYENPLLQRV